MAVKAAGSPSGEPGLDWIEDSKLQSLVIGGRRFLVHIDRSVPWITRTAAIDGLVMLLKNGQLPDSPTLICRISTGGGTHSSTYDSGAVGADDIEYMCWIAGKDCRVKDDTPEFIGLYEMEFINPGMFWGFVQRIARRIPAR